MLTLQRLHLLPITQDEIEILVNLVLKSQNKIDSDINIRFVNNEEMIDLNKTYRGINKTTNVLSFNSELPREIEANFIGDIVICVDVIKKEAKQQNKTISTHITHMIIHGVLHLLEFDHINEDDRKIMENLEIEYLKKLGFNNPYN